MERFFDRSLTFWNFGPFPAAIQSNGMMPEWDLIRQFRAGDRDAFSALYRVHYPSVFRFALHMTGDRLKAGEITQDVFVWLIHHADDFDPGRGELAAFLIGVTRKLIQRRSQTESRFVPFDDMAERPDRGLWDRDERESDAAELRKAIGALPERYREAVVLCDLEEKSYEEAAALLQCALGTVRSRLHRARELLAKKLRARQRCSV